MEKSVHTEQAKTMQRVLKEKRRRAGLTQVELAAKLGCLQSVVSSYERGDRRLDLFELWQVCDAIDADVLEVVTEIIQECRSIRMKH